MGEVGNKSHDKPVRERIVWAVPNFRPMDIIQTTFGPRHYLAVKQTVAISDLADKDIYDLAYARLFGYLGQRGVAAIGPGAILYLDWNEAEGRTQIAIALPVAGLEESGDPDIVVVDIPQTPAIMGAMHGSYEGLKAAHQEINAYMVAHGMQYKGFAIEEYAVDPMTVKDQSELVTNIYYLEK